MKPARERKKKIIIVKIEYHQLVKEEKRNKREGMNQLHFISITLIATMNDSQEIL